MRTAHSRGTILWRTAITWPTFHVVAACLAGGWAAIGQEQQLTRMPTVLIIGTNAADQDALRRLSTSITDLSGDQLERANISSITELARVAPNFSQSDAGLRSFADTYTVRGLGNTEFLSDPGMVLYVDDAPFGDVVSYMTDLLAIDHVEVYRGPQATRFGKDAEAGVINIVTRQPKDKFEAEASASAGGSASAGRAR